MKVITTEKIPIKIWLREIEEEALLQAKNLANFPFAFMWVAIMADAHQGYGMPIGGVLATRGVVVPNAVGVDIGCGVRTAKSNIRKVSQEKLKMVLSKVREKIPLGFKHHRQPQPWKGFSKAPEIPLIAKELKAARCQLGTLGGGNHFLEIQKGRGGFIWFMVHSGSRNFGYKIAQCYNRQAAAFCQKEYPEIVKQELSFLKMDSELGKEYLAAMNFALAFAKANRALLMKRFKEAVVEVFPSAFFDPEIDVHHNYAAWEKHFGRKVIVHRKGAISAQKGELGIIPGSQGTKSYLVKGKGNPESFCSCSHGAGRKMGRRQAIRELNLEKERKRLEKNGILHALRSRSDLEEAAGAYKDIKKVMESQKDLVEIVNELSPLAVIKG